MQELSAAELTAWKGIITDVLREFQDICARHQLTYYAIGGTAIGAVRHHGIIPWDDDIDVGMPRPDFERFIEICRTSDLGHYELVSNETHPDYYLPFPKFCNSNTTLVERADIPCAIGLFIDVFPLDSTSDDPAEVEALVHRYKKLQNRYEAISSRSTFSQHLMLLTQPHEWGRFVNKTLGYFFRKPMKRYLLRKMRALCLKYPYGSTKHLINYGGAYGTRELFSSHIVEGKPINMPFDSITIDLMPGYDDYLKGIYGNYMQMPPEEKRVAHHLKAFYNLNKRVDNPFV
ncbi:phosphorylcholine transferase LicD [Prevotella sp. P6B4]|uniref:LicD family protein n=1 Tax=Prevotella sp. P6B4 TaxID=1410614 RepID=UPI00048B0F3F|nr:LicD family protein [Prevotella sp. P6B4]